MDIKILGCIVKELNKELEGAFINKVHQPLPREIVLRVRGHFPGEKKLMLSADPKLGRIHITSMKIPNPPAPPRFCAFLRAHFQGGRILEISGAENDRIARIKTSRGANITILILELLGRDSNIVLIDERGTILDCLHYIPEKDLENRIMLPGKVYEPPPINPNMARASDVYRTSAATHKARPFSEDNDTSTQTAVDMYYTDVLSKKLFENYRKIFAQPLIKKSKSLKNRLSKIKSDADRLQKYVALQDQGELIKANLYRLKKGLSEAEVTDWDGSTTKLFLNPALDPVANMNVFFKKAAKGKRGQHKVLERLEQTHEELMAVEDQLFFLEQANSISELEELGITAPKTKVNSKPQKNDFQKSYLEYQAPSGLKVYVGKSAGGNDFLLRHKARKNDLWFHVKDYPGAHVILAGMGSSIQDEDIQFAANLALEHSKAKNASAGEVMMTEVAKLSRSKGALPGQVKVTEFSSVMARIE